MKAVQVKEKGGDFVVTDIDKPIPKENEILIKVEACGICHSDAFVKDGAFPGIEYPRVPGHEVVGIVEEVGTRVNNWKKASELVLAGTAVIVLNVNPAAAVILSVAKMHKSVEFPMMVVMRNI